jgi:hypothetical protein
LEDAAIFLASEIPQPEAAEDKEVDSWVIKRVAPAGE